MEKYNINSLDELEQIIINEGTSEQAFKEYVEVNVKPYKDIEEKLGIDLVKFMSNLIDKELCLIKLEDYESFKRDEKRRKELEEWQKKIILPLIKNNINEGLIRRIILGKFETIIYQDEFGFDRSVKVVLKINDTDK